MAFLSAPVFTRGAHSKPDARCLSRVSSRAARRRAAPRCSDMGVGFPAKPADGALRIGVISTRWNAQLVQPLLDDVTETLKAKDVAPDDIVRMEVPGAFELPMAAKLMGTTQKVDAVVCLGVLIKGDTDHYEYIADAVAHGLMDVQLVLNIPVVFGVLTCRDAAQAEARSTGDKSHAADWALTALEMAQLRKSQMGGAPGGKKSVGFF